MLDLSKEVTSPHVNSRWSVADIPQCRKCDRGKPICQRCIDKGLECGGYPDKYRFCGVASRGKHRGENPFSVEKQGPTPASEASTTAQQTPSRSVLKVESSRSTPSISTPVSTPTNSYSIPSKSSTSSPAHEPPAPAPFRPSSEPESALSPEASRQLEELLVAQYSTELLTYFDQDICPHEIVGRDLFGNPFREYFLPLAYEHVGVLHAVLGVSATHRDISRGTKGKLEAEALEHRLQAILSLSKLLEGERERQLKPSEQDALLAIINILVLHDLTENGISSHGAHLTGATYMCERLMANDSLVLRKRTLYLLSYLAWMDLMRGFSEPRKVTFSQESRRKIVDASDNNFAVMAGCPRDIFLAIGTVLSEGKRHALGLLSEPEFRSILHEQRLYLREWDQNSYQYPTDHPEWRFLANAFRHALLLRLLRFPDWSERPANSPEVQHSVQAILDAAAQIPETSPLMNGLTLPLFMAGADSLSEQQRHYILLRLENIQQGTNHQNGTHDILRRVWAGRALRPHDDKSNVPWIDFIHNDNSGRQQDFLTW
ncbi:hypothetical protein BP5796_03432 [Coleophoma crateriformis]|uniref:Zn(2)-C6 fungal-type domain-containing protein n=1 Tax=Coleophoma crateriformis TaxID=565419 RepID=A0A3D8SPL5_9HELO|nr:hypothetical protein BP5796_03432 [Coleophoma crateriformis]